MKINNYYRGSTDRLSGFVFDTERKTYREYVLEAKQWSYKWVKDNCLFSGPLPEFKNPGDLNYYFRTLHEMDDALLDIQRLGFTKDEGMVIDFGNFEF